ncbi:MAG TPA: FAD-dependent oxidoreductase [Ktedonobacteraceae bacterium]
MRTATLVIIGGGIFGTNLAYALATRGARGVVLLEQDVIAAGSSGKATGGLRQQFADELDIRFSREGINFYTRFIKEYNPVEEEYRPPHFYQHGYLFLCSNQESWQTLQSATELQQALGVHTQLLSPDEISVRVPQLVVDDLLGGTFCPTDGYSDPGAMTRVLAHAASTLGVTILEHAPVKAIQVKHNKIMGVSTPQETISTPLVINATGVYAALTARLAGMTNLPIWPLKRQLYQTESFEDLPQNVPMVVDVSTGFHFRRRDGGVIVTMPLPISPLQMAQNKKLEPESFALHLDETLWPLLQSEMQRRCPTLAQASIQRAWAGLYEMTPDDHPVLGRTHIEGFLCGFGFAGHGFMHSPMAARLLAESILAPQQSNPDLEIFSLERFMTGKLIKTTSFL